MSVTDALVFFLAHRSKGLEGSDAFPHLSFWSEFWSLVMEVRLNLFPFFLATSHCIDALNIFSSGAGYPFFLGRLQGRLGREGASGCRH